MKKAKLLLIGLDSVPMKLVNRFASEGALPRMKALMRRGVWAEALASVPAYTPTNWATLCTGAHPGSTGAANWVDSAPDDPPDRTPLSTFDSRAILCETVFESAARQGLKTLAISYPGSSPPRAEGVYALAPLEKGLKSLAVLPGCVYSTAEKPRAKKIEIKGGEAEIEVVGENELAGWGYRAAERAGAVEDGAQLSPAAAGEGGAMQRLSLVFRAGPPPVLVTRGGETLSTLVPRAWSSWAKLTVGTPQGQVECTVRFFLREFDPSKGTVEIIRSELYPTDGFARPAELASALSGLGGFIEHTSFMTNDPQDYFEIIVDEARYQADWIARAAARTMDASPYDILYLHWHYPDSVLHHLLGPADPLSPVYAGQAAEEYVEAIRQSFAVGDELVGKLTDSLADENTLVVVVSDHGNSANRFAVDIKRRLVETGLASFDAKGGLDAGKSRVLPYGGLQLVVNRHVVGAADFDRTVADAMSALLDWRAPSHDEASPSAALRGTGLPRAGAPGGERAVSFAFRKEDAAQVGFYGPRCGDIVFCYSPGFAWTAVQGEGSVSVSAGGANHGPQLPTTSTGFSSNLSLFIMAGKGVKQGETRDVSAYGLFRLLDVVPTFCRLLGIKPPAACAGAVAYDLLS